MTGDTRQPIDEDTERALWRRGVSLLESGKPQDAVKYLLHLADVDPPKAEYLNKLGVAYAKCDNNELALECFERALQVDPRYAPAVSNIGNIYYARKDYPQAEPYYRRAISLDPDYYIAHRNLAAALRKQGRIAASVAALKTADKIQHREVVERERDARSQPSLPTEERAVSGPPRRVGPIVWIAVAVIAIAIWMLLR